ncbi:MAG: S46 family peptidase [Bacteroidia bacterium]|nr:S46 family peptidase [Bacteroidia bacterium]
MKKITVLILFIVSSVLSLRADEGMWPLTLIKQLENQMQAKGLKLSAEDIYSINKSCLKDAVLRLMQKNTNRMFCTGEIISNEGLFLTNHHCGYGSIQELSTPQDNILKNGFWAKTKGEERLAKFNVGILVKVEDVTDMVIGKINVNDEELIRTAAINDRLNKTKEELINRDGKNYIIDIVAFYNGNKYLAMFYEVYKDVRLVGTPPENIGKFGGETDNWMWPRHTCDFSMFRIYVDKDNKPAEFSNNNIPYTPKHFFPISLKGYKPGDFAMIMGYPGRTSRYTYSEGINFYANIDRPSRVKVRRAILDIYEESMIADPDIKLMYADKFAGLSNYWKKFKGEVDGLKKLKLYERRKEAEKNVREWIKANQKEQIYNEMFPLYDDVFAKLNKYGLYQSYFSDGIMNSQALSIALSYSAFEKLYATGKPDEETKKKIDDLAAKNAKALPELFHEFYIPIEKKVFAKVIQYLYEDIDHSLLPIEIIKLVDKYKKDYNKMAEVIFKKSMFVSKEKLEKFNSKPDYKKLKKDPVYIIAFSYYNKMNTEYKPIFDEIKNKLERANRLFQNAMMEMNAGKLYNPDANATMRLTYGTVEQYQARDAVMYKEYTSANGVIEKFTPGDIEFDAPQKLIDLMKKKDFGQYADSEGNLHTCFLTTNDITGGNSGSPVINGNGELIGTAFDGNWEAISSDFAFEPDLQRTISVDIRYTLFILDKFAGAGHLLNEMKIIK